MKFRRPDMGAVGRDAGAAAERLAGAIRFRTIAHAEHDKIDGAPFLALHEYLMKSYPLAAERLSWEAVEDYSLLLTWKGGGGGRPLALLAHMDVVPVESGTEKDWAHGAYSGDIDGTYVWGRGAMDMKGHLVCVLEAVEGLLREGFRPANDVYLCFGHNEEIIEAPRSGAKAMMRLLRERGVALDMIIDEGGVVMPGSMMLGTEGLAAVVGTAEKGYMDVRLSCAQGGGHSSQPPSSTALGIVARAVAKLERRPFRPRLIGTVEAMLKTAGRSMGFGKRLIFANLWLFKPLLLGTLIKKPMTNALVRTTCAATMASGSPAPNVLPQRAEAVVNVRLLPGDDMDGALAAMRKAIDDDRVAVEIMKGRNPSEESPTDTEGYRLVKFTLEAMYPGILVMPYLMVGGTDSCMYAPVCRNIYRIAPFLISGEELKTVHGTNERISVENLARGAAFFKAVIRGL
jgi:carboxypeptidase PM20D1